MSFLGWWNRIGWGKGWSESMRRGVPDGSQSQGQVREVQEEVGVIALFPHLLTGGIGC